MKKLTLLILFGISLTPLAFAANPPEDASASIEATDKDTEAEGDRSSESALEMRQFPIAGSRKATIELTLEGDFELDDGYPKWTGDGLTGDTDEKLSVDWEHNSSSSIEAEICEGVTKKIDINLTPAPKTKIEITSEKLDSYKEKINSILNKISDVKDAVEVDGSIKGSHQRCDFADDGEVLGQHIILQSDIELRTKKIAVKSRLVPMGYAISAQIGGEISALFINLTITGEYNESRTNPRSISGELKGGANAKGFVKGLVGLSAGEKSLGISIKGETQANFTVSGTIKSDAKKVTASGKSKMGNVKFKVTAQAELIFGQVELASLDNVTLIKAETKDLEEITLYTYPE